MSLPNARSGASGALRAIPASAFLALTALTFAMAITRAPVQVLVAPATSSIVFALGWALAEPDLIYLSWLDQGTNLTLLETQLEGASILIVALTVVAVLILADLGHISLFSAPYGRRQGTRQLRTQLPRLLAVGVVSSVFALVGLYVAPVLSAGSDAIIVVAVLSVVALAAIATLGSVDS